MDDGAGSLSSPAKPTSADQSLEAGNGLHVAPVAVVGRRFGLLAPLVFFADLRAFRAGPSPWLLMTTLPILQHRDAFFVPGAC